VIFDVTLGTLEVCIS